MNRLDIMTRDRAEVTIEMLYGDMQRRIIASPPGLCTIGMLSSFLRICHAQTCGKCAPCRIGLTQLTILIEDIMDGRAERATIDLIETTARVIYNTADCAIGYGTADMVLRWVVGFRDELEDHILHRGCSSRSHQLIPCISLCPAGINIPGCMALIAEGRYDEAVRLIRKDNPMPAVCALVCEHPCEIKCRRQMIDASINIRGLNRFAVENAGAVPAEARAPSTGKKVAIVGGGASGLSAAYYLSIMGHSVTIYEREDKLGGMLRFGIPNFRLPREILDDDIDTIISTGIEVHYGIEIGEEISILDLRKEYDAIYIAVGIHVDRRIWLQNQRPRGIISAIEALKLVENDEHQDLRDKSIVIIGGNNAAIDTARSAIRLGAKKVRIIYRRRIEDMPATRKGIEAAIAEGCEILDLSIVGKTELDESGHIRDLWIKSQIVGDIQDGKPIEVHMGRDTQKVDCDLLIIAIAQGIEPQSFEGDGISAMEGIIDIFDEGGIGNMPGIYAGGDCVSGPST
ncbi:MAG: FAD-dependent oxidoreductase, partial [Tissierellia bacterium]|nr:FAD-dependent oxidoreductase [Tissierellia bacterium]